MSASRPSIAPSPGSLAPRVECLERHDQAYHLWRAAGLQHQVLVHIDAHHDMWWCAGPKDLHIGNFVCHALREGIVDEVFWVVPDATWQNVDSRRAVVRHLEHLHAQYPGHDRSIQIDGDTISTRFIGKRLTVCSIQSLPPISQPVLLDIDVDYLVIPFVCQGETDAHAPIPWRWPDELIDRVQASGIRSDLVTIAYSVDGGYTPLKWKYLGDECAARLTASCEGTTGFDQLRAGAIAAHDGKWHDAEAAFRRAAELLPRSATPLCHLAHCYLAAGRDADARAAWQEALRLDATYRTPYNTSALQRFYDRQDVEAESEWRRALVFNPSDANAHLGFALLAQRKKSWTAAENHARKALDIDADLIDAWRTLGRAQAEQQRTSEAIVSYERSIRLALAGRRPIGADVATVTDNRPADPDFFLTFNRLARLYAAKGDLESALENHRIAAAGRIVDPWLHARLGRLYLERGRVDLGARECWRSLRSMPSALRAQMRRRRRKAGQAERAQRQNA